MTALYNETDPFCAAWLRNLIDAGLIPHGVVDERSIEDIAPVELALFTQFHTFAGLGGWPLALRLAGWPDDRPIWTGSCPCQPFSAAGKGGGFADERHLWPAFDWLIGQCRPDIVLGEQVEGPAGRKWLDLVATDLEGHGYAFGTAVFPAAGVGAPQIRHRTYWMANRTGEGLERTARARLQRRGAGLALGGEFSGLADRDDARLEGRRGMPERADQCAVGADGVASRLARPDEGQRGRLASCGGSERDRQARGWQQGDGGASGDCEAGRVGNAAIEPRERDAGSVLGAQEEVGREDGQQHGNLPFGLEYAGSSVAPRPGPVNGFWRAPDWLYCRDDKWRPVESGTFPLATGVPARVGKLRAAGNALCVPQAEAFIEAVMSARL